MLNGKLPSATSFSKYGLLLACGFFGEIKLLNVILDTATVNSYFRYYGHPMALSPDNSFLAIESTDGTVRLFDALTRVAHATRKSSTDYGSSDFSDNATRSVAFASDGKQLALASGNDTVMLRDVFVQSHSYEVHGAGLEVRHIAFSLNGKILAIA